MNRILVARIVLTVIGVVAWGYGHSTDNSQMRIAGIGVLAVSLLLRFFVRKPEPRP